MFRQRHGYDVIEAASVSQRERYLAKVCADLPSIGSEERERLRKGYSFQEYLQRSRSTTGTAATMHM